MCQGRLWLRGDLSVAQHAVVPDQPPPVSQRPSRAEKVCRQNPCRRLAPGTARDAGNGRLGRHARSVCPAQGGSAPASGPARHPCSRPRRQVNQTRGEGERGGLARDRGPLRRRRDRPVCTAGGKRIRRMPAWAPRHSGQGPRCGNSRRPSCQLFQDVGPLHLRARRELHDDRRSLRQHGPRVQRNGGRHELLRRRGGGRRAAAALAQPGQNRLGCDAAVEEAGHSGRQRSVHTSVVARDHPRQPELRSDLLGPARVHAAGQGTEPRPLGQEPVDRRRGLVCAARPFALDRRRHSR